MEVIISISELKKKTSDERIIVIKGREREGV